MNKMIGLDGRNKNKCACYVCKAQAELRKRYDIEGCVEKMERGEGYLLNTPQMKRSICKTHIGYKNLMEYHWRDWASEFAPVQWCDCTPKKGIIEAHTVGSEFEICEAAGDILDESILTYARCELEFVFNSIAEEDCTVLMEIPSGVVQGLAKYKLLKTFDNIKVDDSMTLTKALFSADDTAGSHTHCFCNDITYVRKNYKSLFNPLENFLKSLPEEKIIEFFGRSFGSWADFCCWDSPTRHSNFINTQHDKTVEFRLPRIHSYSQYIEVVKMWREIVANINLLHKAGWEAEKIGLELIKVASKYIN